MPGSIDPSACSPKVEPGVVDRGEPDRLGAGEPLVGVKLAGPLGLPGHECRGRQCVGLKGTYGHNPGLSTGLKRDSGSRPSLLESMGDQSRNQSSTCNPGTLWKWRRFADTSVPPWDKAIAAIRESIGPMSRRNFGENALKRMEAAASK